MLAYRLKSIHKKIFPSVYVLVAQILLRNIKNQKNIKILDIGGGKGEYWLEIRNCISRDSIRNIEVWILDPMAVESPKLKQIEGLNLCQTIGMAPDSLLHLTNNSFDFVVGLDVIEHLDQANGYLLVYEMERICKLSAIIFTPNGFVWQPPNENNRFNAHISGWKPRNFSKMPQWKVRGASGFKFLYGPYAHPKYSYLSYIFGGLSQIVTYRIPSAAFSILAIYKK